MDKIEKNQKQIDKVVNTGSFVDCNAPDQPVNFDLLGVQNLNFTPLYTNES